MNKLNKFALGIAAFGMTSFSLAEPATQPTTDNVQRVEEAPGEKVTMDSGLTVIVVQAGSEYATKKGDHVWVHYSGRLENGKVFDNSHDRGEPIDLTLGQGRVIKGWEEGLLGMKLGEKRQLIIPPALGYGERGAGEVIPPNATLIFDVELVGVKRG